MKNVDHQCPEETCHVKKKKQKKTTLQKCRLFTTFLKTCPAGVHMQWYKQAKCKWHLKSAEVAKKQT